MRHLPLQLEGCGKVGQAGRGLLEECMQGAGLGVQRRTSGAGPLCSCVPCVCITLDAYPDSHRDEAVQVERGGKAGNEAAFIAEDFGLRIRIRECVSTS